MSDGQKPKISVCTIILRGKHDLGKGSALHLAEHVKVLGCWRTYCYRMSKSADSAYKHESVEDVVRMLNKESWNLCPGCFKTPLGRVVLAALKKRKKAESAKDG